MTAEREPVGRADVAGVLAEAERLIQLGIDWDFVEIFSGEDEPGYRDREDLCRDAADVVLPLLAAERAAGAAEVGARVEAVLASWERAVRINANLLGADRNETVRRLVRAALAAPQPPPGDAPAEGTR